MNAGDNNLSAVKDLYQNLLTAWNNNQAVEFSVLFSEDAGLTGFDGSQMRGREDIRDQLSKIFKNHQVASYVSIVKEVRVLAQDIILLQAIVGMVPPGKSEINDKTNAFQTLIAQKINDKLLIVHFQNTPASFHERPDLKKQMTQALQQEFDKKEKDKTRDNYL